jgi:hypothetical protein
MKYAEKEKKREQMKPRQKMRDERHPIRMENHITVSVGYL